MKAIRTAWICYRLRCARDDLRQHRAIAGPKYRANVRAHIAALRVELALLNPHARDLRAV